MPDESGPSEVVAVVGSDDQPVETLGCRESLLILAELRIVDDRD
jgi:hypothetical protein